MINIMNFIEVKKSKVDIVNIPKEPEIDLFADYEILSKPRT